MLTNLTRSIAAKDEACGQCHGLGVVEGHTDRCRSCHGTGYVPRADVVVMAAAESRPLRPIEIETLLRVARDLCDELEHHSDPRFTSARVRSARDAVERLERIHYGRLDVRA